ncbi:transglycosylase domain-containing protein [Lysobacter silvisoli]|uniref:transglycosylase domain-containing protein n=1 Tax=Lysobacter silvisoli TaxID=2293254 RepID=UPI0011C027A7|nr:transglycosylase domain-containing protein [Lysobacter silvisoli]
MSAWPKWVIGAALALVFAFVAFIYGLYWYGAAALPAELPRPRYAYTDAVRADYWASLGGRGPIVVERWNPLTLCWHVYTEVQEPGPHPRRPDFLMVQSVARQISADHQLHQLRSRRPLAEIAALIRVSRERSPEQIVDLVLDEGWMGLNTRGLREAAPAYFGVTHERLTRAERLALFGLMKGPSYFDPNRDLERFRTRYAYVAQVAGTPPDRIDPERDLARLILTPPTTSPTEQRP